MKSYVKPIMIAIVAAGGAAYAANQTVTMNVIDAGGIGKACRISRILCGHEINPAASNPIADHDAPDNLLLAALAPPSSLPSMTGSATLVYLSDARG
jgi:hypothetical protein